MDIRRFLHSFMLAGTLVVLAGMLPLQACGSHQAVQDQQETRTKKSREEKRVEKYERQRLAAEKRIREAELKREAVELRRLAAEHELQAKKAKEESKRVKREAKEARKAARKATKKPKD